MNELQKKLGPKGLVVVGVTNESESEVVKDVAKSKMRHPIVMVQGDDADRVYGIKGFPSGFLIDPTGTIIWEGHPGKLAEEIDLEALLANMVVPPTVPAEFKDVRAALTARKYGKAQAAITKALAKAPENAELKAAAASITKTLESRLAAAKAALDAQDYGTAMTVYTEIATQYEGVPGAEAGKAGIDALKKDKAAAPELAALEKLQAAIAQWRKGELEKALKAYASIVKKYPDTPSGKRAAELAALHEE